MAILAIDLVDNNDGELTWRGYKFTRNAVVTSPVEQSGRIDDSARIFEAINDTGVPEINDPHPSVGDCLLKRIFCESIEPNILTLRLEYETPTFNWQIKTIGQEDISMEASLLQTETTKDYAGANLAAVSYQYAINTPNPAEPVKADGTPNLLGANLTLRSELPVVPIYIPARVYTIRKRLQNTDEDELETLNEAYQGHVNDDTWRTLYSARTWLCMGITWRTTDFRSTYLIEVRFQYKFDTYNAQVVFRDPYTGKVPGDVFSQPAAYEAYRIQREADFDALLSSLGI